MDPNKIKILAIDDNKDNLTTLKALIRESFPDATVFTANNGAEGLRMAVAKDPDVILLDIIMPGIDGFEVCKTLKTDKSLSEIPIIFLIAKRDDKDSRVKALECGGEAFLSIPIDVTELKAQIIAMVKLKVARREKRAEKENLAKLIKQRTREMRLTHTATLNLLEDIQNENEARKKSEQALKESEERYRSVAQSANDAIITTNSRGIVTDWNKGAEFTFGYTEAEIKGKDLALIIPLEHLINHQNGIQKKTEKRNDSLLIGKTVELTGMHKDGHRFPIELSLAEWESSTGRFFTGIIRDITERKAAQDELQRSRDLLFKLSEQVPGVIYQYRLYPDGSSCFPYSSSGMEKIYEVTPDEVREDATPVFGRLHPDDSKMVSDLIFESARTQERFYCEYRVILPRQGLRWRYSDALPELLEDGSTLWHGIIYDITDRKLEDVKRSHTDRMVNLGEMAAGIAHEINQPLNIISLVTDSVLYETTRTEMIDSIFLKNKSDKIFENITRIRNIIDHIRAFSRTNDDFILSTFDVNTTIENAVSLVAEQFKNHSIRLDLNFGKRLPKLFGNTYKLEQVIINLLSNARDAVLEKKRNAGNYPEMVVAILTYKEKGRIIIEVSDNGIGIPGNMISDVVLPFYTTKDSGKGTGLGLSICYQIIKEMGGSLEITSDVSLGTTITVELDNIKTS
ncbi:MAG: PAS domain S-box protein [Bacteroidetes bacterium]|nr:PAS domain S-box protein [Bacteroidota bacterium]